MRKRKRTYYNEIREREPKHLLLKSIKAFNRITLILIALGLVSLFGYQVYIWALQTPFFEVKQMRIRGNQHLSRERILELAQIEPRCNLFLLQAGEIEERLSENCLIREATIRRRWPCGILIIIEERQPIAFLENNAGLIDDEGVFLPSLSPDHYLGLPMVSGIDVEGEEYGLPLQSEKVRWVIFFMGELAQKCPGLSVTLDRIDIRDPDHPLLYTGARSVPIKVGGRDCFSRLGGLPLVFADLERKGVDAECIDVRFKDQIIVKRKMKRSMGLESKAVKG